MKYRNASCGLLLNRKCGDELAVNSIRFHPNELLALTASGDTTCHVIKPSSTPGSRTFTAKIERHEVVQSLFFFFFVFLVPSEERRDGCVPRTNFVILTAQHCRCL
jgi:hypothetical protein